MLRRVCRSAQHAGQVNAEGGQQAVDVRGEAYCYSHIRDRVLENEIPADNPRDQLTERCIRVGVRAACDGNHRSQLGVAESREPAHHGDQEERERNGRSCPGASRDSGGVAPV